MSAGDRIAEQVERFEREAAAVENREAWESLRQRWVGRREGAVRQLLATLKDLPPEERPDFGQEVNRLKGLVEERLAALDASLGEAERRARERVATPVSGRCIRPTW